MAISLYPYAMPAEQEFGSPFVSVLVTQTLLSGPFVIVNSVDEGKAIVADFEAELLKRHPCLSDGGYLIELRVKKGGRKPRGWDKAREARELSICKPLTCKRGHTSADTVMAMIRAEQTQAA